MSIGPPLIAFEHRAGPGECLYRILYQIAP